MQVDPVRPTLTAAGAKRLKLKYNDRLPHCAFKFNSRRYTEAATVDQVEAAKDPASPPLTTPRPSSLSSAAAAVAAARVRAAGMAVGAVKAGKPGP